MTNSEATCRGSILLGTACRRCSRCKAELDLYQNAKATAQLLKELYDWADGYSNGVLWRFRDQPIAKRVAAHIRGAA